MQPPITMKIVRLALATFILVYGVVSGASPELERSQSEFITAADAFQSGQYDKALELYSAIEERGHESADLFFNLGNTYTRLSKPGLAIKAYREAFTEHLGPPTLKPILSLSAGKQLTPLSLLRQPRPQQPWRSFISSFRLGKNGAYSWLSTSYFGHHG